MDNESALPEQPAQPEPVPPAAPDISRAGFWVRGGAYLIDASILTLCIFLPVHGLGFLVGFAYKTIFISQGGQTPGKMAAGIKVVAVDGQPVGVGRALARAVSEYLSAIVLCIGYMVAGSSDKRALHDYISGTRVVYVDGVTNGRKTLFAVLGVFAVLIPFAAGIALATFGAGGLGKFKELATKSGEGATKGNLGMLRSSLSIYYGDAEGQYPATLEALIPKYLPAIPKTKLDAHMETNVWTPYGAEVCTGKTEYGTEIDSTKLKDTGGWGYVVDAKAKCYGMVFVDCTHQDTKGKRWPEY
jgi:uncharacterized RDD family membrane protein YckC